MIPHYHAIWQPASDRDQTERGARVGLPETAEGILREKGALALTVAGIHAGISLRMTNTGAGKFEIRDARDQSLWAVAWVESCTKPNCPT